MPNYIMASTLIAKSESVNESLKSVESLTKLIMGDAGIHDKFIKYTERDPQYVLHQIKVDLEGYAEVLQHVINSTQVAWPPDGSKLN